MADVASSFKDWSTSAASNQPTSSTVIGSGLAPNFQQLQATLRKELGSRSGGSTASSTVDLGSVDDGTVLINHLSGTVAISSFGTVGAGIKKLVTFNVTSGTLTLTYNATSMILPSGADIQIANGDSLIVESLGSGNWKVHFYSKPNTAISFGECKLSKSGANLLLSPFNGNSLTINGQIQSIPSSGVTLAPPATTLTLYYIYAYMSGSTMTLEASTTAYAVDSSTGMTVKSGDSTRTLVGMARTVSNAWVDSSAQRFVRSWFNDDGIVSFNYLPSGVSNNTSGMIELNSSARAEFLSWLGETVNGFFNGYITSSGSGNAFTSIGVDGTTATDALSAGTVGSASAAMPAICNLVTNSLTEGYHYMTMLGQNQAATMTWAGSASVGSRCSISVRAKK